MNEYWLNDQVRSGTTCLSGWREDSSLAKLVYQTRILRQDIGFHFLFTSIFFNVLTLHFFLHPFRFLFFNTLFYFCRSISILYSFPPFLHFLQPFYLNLPFLPIYLAFLPINLPFFPFELTFLPFQLTFFSIPYNLLSITFNLSFISLRLFPFLFLFLHKNLASFPKKQ